MQIKLKKFGTTLTSRQFGKEALLAFRPTLNKISKKEKLEVDFEGVITFSPSWADEFLTSLFKKYGKRMILKNTNNVSVRDTLDFLEEIHGFKFNRENLK